MQYQCVAAIAYKSRQCALPVQPVYLLRLKQLLQPIVIAQICGGLGYIEVAMEPVMRKRAVADRQCLLGIDHFGNGRLRVLRRAQARGIAIGLDQRVAVVEIILVQQSVVRQRIHFDGVVPLCLCGLP